VKPRVSEFRFYEELGDLLPPHKRKVTFSYSFSGSPSIKDAVEAIGVPHTEVDLIVVGGRSVGFDYHLQDGDRVAVYPTFESIDISPVTRLKARPLRTTRFIVDTHLGKLARKLRMLGFDTLYETDYDERTLMSLATAERRIILTRDRGILKNKLVTHGYCLRSDKPDVQVREVIDRFDLKSVLAPFARCMECNGHIVAVDKDAVIDRVPPQTAEAFDDYFRCESCGNLYWRGSHYEKMKAWIDTFFAV